MASKYPGELDSLPTNKTNSTVAKDDHAPNHNNANDAINKIEAELGTNPSGSAETVAARIAALEGSANFSATVLNVKDYGAVGDGEADDTAAIQAALDAARDAGGGVVFVPSGDYALAGTLTIDNFVALEGAGRSSRLLATTDADLLKTARYGKGGADSGAEGFELRNLCFDGAGKEGAVLLDGIAARVSNVWFEDVGGGVLSEMEREEPHQGMESYWSDVWMMDCAGFEFYGPHDSQLTNVIVRRAGEGPCIVAGVVSVWTNCHTYGFAEYGIVAAAGAQFLNCQAEGTEKAKLRIVGDGVRWIGGRIFSAGGEDGGVGIEWGDGEATANSAQIRDVEIAGCTEALLFTYPGNGSVVSGFVWGPEGAEAIHGEPADGEIDWRGLVVRPPMVYGFAEAEDAQGKGFRAHGEDSTAARPYGPASVEWFGTVEPEHAQVGDTWIDPS